jgi:hypothetical protein
MKNRYFTHYFDDDQEEIDIEEISKTEFDSIEGKKTSERHTMFTNGVNQVCHTVIPSEF